MGEERECQRMMVGFVSLCNTPPLMLRSAAVFGLENNKICASLVVNDDRWLVSFKCRFIAICKCFFILQYNHLLIIVVKKSCQV